MSSKEAREFRAGLERVRQRFEHWRRTHRGRSRISDSLWAAAVKAARSHGICRTAKALRVDYYSLKERLEQASAGTQGLSQANFLELPPLAPASLGECTVEWKDAAGSTMRVHLKCFPAPDLAALGRSFWS
jgi:transposase